MASAPASPGDVEAVHDEMAAGPFDAPRGDGQALGKVEVAVEHAPFGNEVIGAVVGAHALAVGSSRRVALRQVPAATSLECSCRTEKLVL